MGKKGGRRPEQRPALALVATGVPGLDEVLGGGLPEFSFNLIAGGPGAGKTTLAMQIMFANATPDRPALYFTLLGETALKMLRYQQQFDFFDLDRVGSSVHFCNLSREALDGELDEVLARVVAEVERIRPAYVVIDSFRSLTRIQLIEGPDRALEHFVQRLALYLTTWEVTSFLIGEYDEPELRNPVFTIADGILWLSQAPDRNSVVRKLQVVKVRGLRFIPGLHTLRISTQGIQAFPRVRELAAPAPRRKAQRLSTGIERLDEMMGGGIGAGDSVVLAGPTGTGKTTFAMQFVIAGLREGESAVIAVFEERPEAYVQRASAFGSDFRKAIEAGRLRIIYLRPLDLSVDETLEELRLAVAELAATRVVIDSISGFEIALAPTFREDFRESFYRLIGALADLGVTILSTVEVLSDPDGFRLTGHSISFLTDAIVNLRYIEVDGELRKALTVVKMRGSSHSREFRAYDLTSTGIVIRESLRGFEGIITGVPTRQSRGAQARFAGLSDQDVVVLESLLQTAGGTAAAISRATGLDKPAVADSLRRLLEMHFIQRRGARYLGAARVRKP